MPVFICEKCGRLDNSAGNNNFWLSTSNKFGLFEKNGIRHFYEDSYFDTHSCCSICCKGLKYRDGSSNDRFMKNKFDTVSEKTYKEMRDEDIRCCENYDEIMKRDKENNNGK